MTPGKERAVHTVPSQRMRDFNANYAAVVTFFAERERKPCLEIEAILNRYLGDRLTRLEACCGQQDADLLAEHAALHLQVLVNDITEFPN